MNLRAVDLNLLVVLEALLVHKHVSKAAETLNMSQPAVSRALKRLRETLDDPVLVRSGSGYDLSARATELQAQLKVLLQDVTAIMQPQKFIPEITDGTIRLSGLDLELIVLMPEMIRQLRYKAPRLTIEVVSQLPDHFGLLAKGEVHFTFTGLSPTINQDQFRRMPIAKTGHVCVMDKRHYLATKPLTLEDYANASHGLVSITGKGPGMMDLELDKLGLKRKVMLRLASFMSVTEYCRGSDLIFTIPEAMAKHLAKDDDLVICPLPDVFKLEPVVLYLYWHERFHQDPMCRWVREQFCDLFSPELKV